MLILSHYAGHDPAVCILRDGEILLNLEKERVSRIRHDIGMDRAFVDKCLEWAGVSMRDVDILVSQLGDVSKVGSPCEALFQGNMDYGYRFERELEGRRIPEIRVHHHLAHAASALFTSPFSDAVLLTWDGGGDNANVSIGLAKSSRISRWKPTTNVNIASWFRYIGLKNFGMPATSPSDLGSQAGKVMALAAYGSPDEDIKQRLQSEIALFPHTVGFNAGEDLSDARSKRAQNVAAALQSITEEYLEVLFERAYIWGEGVKNLCFAGGVALNCVANTKAFEKSEFSDLYVPPCSNDGGLALGQALLVHHQILANPHEPGHFNGYNGPIHGEDEVERAIQEAALTSKSVSVRPVCQDALVELLVAGEVIAMYRGASETGPRALGHRSLICRPDSESTRDFLNDEVKQREWFRPFAPIVLEAHSDALFESNFPKSPYMATTATIRPEWRGRLSAVCHVDGTTRPQILRSEHEPWLFELLEKFHHATGIPAIVNTSFNRREPIVETPDEAIKTFLEMPVRYLCLNGWLLEKVGVQEIRESPG